ncbi:Signal recognition particle subunit SRP72 [Lithohypha guttulata]|uniref:Signal recognition particle subunit SRP72 n=1 Tax=Lithohypha guttulata TaxID=1690604 RepID=UPI002DDFBCD6|nr:Signal recognition particle subunit SRP72 [Lithohypha guttulata]
MSSTLASLFKKSTIDDPAEALKACEATLRETSDDSQAQQTKAVALLKLERYQDALQYFEQTASLQGSIPEVYAYCLYRAGKFEEAVKVASAVEDSRGAHHITLQAAYRAEDWDAANKACLALSKSKVQKEEFDLRINKLALDAEALWLERLSAGSIPRATTDDLAAFETAYNAACISVSKGQLQEADILLKRAVNLCEHHEELSAEDKAVELVPLKAQRIFVLQKLQKHDEAAELAKELSASLKDAAVDVSTRKLAENNILASVNVFNPFLAHKTFSSSSVPKSERLFANQSTSLKLNEQAMQLQTFKYDGLIHSARKKSFMDALPSTSPDSLLTSMFGTAALARNEVSKAAVNKVLPELEKRPNDVGLVVTLVQLYVLTGNGLAAVDMLRALFDRLEKSPNDKDQDVRYSPGLIGLMVSLLRTQGRRSQLNQELARGATYWRTKPKAPSSLLRAAGIALLESSHDEDTKVASEIFEKLYAQEPEDRSAIAGYVASHATDSTADVKSLSGRLSSIDELTASINADSLENAGIPQSANALAIAQAGQSRKRPAVDGLSSKKKRIRPSRMPKDYDPNKKPDPERWLPLRDRSTYKPKKKRGKRDDRTQGGGNVNEALDISNRPAGTGSEVVSGNTAGNKKKKGKGKK